MVVDRHRQLREESHRARDPDDTKVVKLNSMQLKGVERQLRAENHLLEDARSKVESLTETIKELRTP